MHARSRILALLALVLPAVASSQPGGSLAFHGTPVAPRGAATLSISPAGNLVVGNIGPSGLDGFDLLTGRAEGVKVKFPWLPSTPAGREVHVEVPTELTGVRPQLMWTVAPINGVDIFVDFSSMGATALLVDVYDDGVPVTQTLLSAGDTLRCDEGPVALEVEMGGIPAIGISPLVPTYDKLPAFKIALMQKGTAFGPAGPIGEGDEIRVYPWNPTSLPSEMTRLRVLFDQATPSAPYTVQFEDAAQLLEGRLHRGTMFGLISKDFEAEVKFNVDVPAGLAGGLVMESKPSETAQTITQNIKLADAGDTDAYFVTGDPGNGLPVELARISGACNGGSWVLAPDFSGSGYAASVQLFDAAGVALTPPSPILGDIVVGTNALPVRSGFDIRDGLAIAYDYMNPVPVTISQGTFLANKIMMFGQGDVPTLATQTGRDFSFASDLTIQVTGEPNQIQTSGDDGFFMSADGAGQYVRSVDACPCVEAVDDGLHPGASFTFEPVVQQDQFGIEWVPDDSPAGTTTAEHAARISSDQSLEVRMAIRIEYDGVTVKLYSEPRQTPKRDFGDRIKAGTTTVAEFTHSDETVPFAILPTWPEAIGYQVLHNTDETWSMWINLGQMMPITIPGDPARGSAAPTQVVTGDFIHVTYLDTPITGIVQESKLVLRSFNKSHRLFRAHKTTAVAVGPTPTRAPLAMRAPYPNPFNPSTTLSFDIPSPGDVSIRVYTVRGEYVATLHSGWMAAGPHAVNWDGVNHRGSRAASGVYLVELRAPDGTRHAKLNLLK